MFALAERLWPSLKTMNLQRRLVSAGEVLTFLYSAPLALVGLIWLGKVTDIQIIRQNWSMLALLAVLMLLFRKLGFFMIAEIRAGRYASSDGSMESMILWIGVFLYGPSALWLAVFWSFVDFLERWRYRSSVFDRWSRARNFSMYLAGTILGTLISLVFYQNWGGAYPIANLSFAQIAPALGAIIIHMIVVMLFWSPYITYAVWSQIQLTETRSIRPVVLFLLTALGLLSLSDPFAILAAGLLIQNGFPTFLFFMVGLVMVALLTRQLSWAAESRRQQSRQLERLEQLGRDILNAPPDASSLPLLLREHLPYMFPSGRLAIWVEPDRFFLTHPFDWEVDIKPVWGWLQQQNQPHAFLAHDQLPWESNPPDSGKAEHNAILAMPILDVEQGDPIGGLYLELFSLAQPWDQRSLTNLFPAARSLAAQVASALHQAEIYEQALAYQRVTQELALAGKIQASFLPSEMPRLSGWQIAVTLQPARETSGDFFDLIPLENGKLGILIADVTDKGVGAALYMALARTLIRTYAIEFGDDPQPDVVLFAANRRILEDAHADLFVTAFYGILDPETGVLAYSNAGHNPPYLLSYGEGENLQTLKSTGMPIGVEEDTLWGKESIQIQPGDLLVLYTDGIPDAQNSQGEFYEDRLLREVMRTSQAQGAQEVQDSILASIQDFIGSAPQFDDITLIVLERDLEEPLSETMQPGTPDHRAGASSD